jgi:hypothetical protein
MLVLNRPKNEQIMTGENVALIVADVCGINSPSEISGSLTKVCKVKVLVLRQHLNVTLVNVWRFAWVRKRDKLSLYRNKKRTGEGVDD